MPKLSKRSEGQKRYWEQAALSIQQTMYYLGMGRSKVNELIKRGDLESFKIDGARRVIKESADRLIEQNMTTSK